MNNEQSLIRRIGGYLHRIVPVADSSGKLISYAVKPLMVEFRPRDLLQVIVGATILAIPLAYTEEIWVLGSELPWINVTGIAFVSVLFLSLFIFFNYYRFSFKEHRFEYIKRVVATYVFALLVVGLILTLIDKAPWMSDWETALKRTMIVGFPASMSATISDIIK